MTKIYLISNNLLLDKIAYDNTAKLELIRFTRPLSINGDELSKKICNSSFLSNVEKIYASFYSSAISTAKYASEKYDLKIHMQTELNECLVGDLGSKNMKMVKGLQDHEFTYKLQNGESLVDVGNRLDNFIKRVINENVNSVLFTHKRAIVGFLLKHCEVGYNLDEYLILSYKDRVIYDDTETEFDIYELEIENNKIINIENITNIDNN